AISVEGDGGAPTIAEVRDAEQMALEHSAKAHPMVQAVFDAFPNAKILQIRTPEAIAAEAQSDALPEVEDEWDPFDED
ncbi:MAG: DNA polymerase III subunit gamma/tau, partial [Pseudomonadota bacterium]